VLYCIFHSDLKEGTSMASILIHIFQGWPAIGRETCTSGLCKWGIQRAFMPFLFFSFFFKCPWGIANQLAMGKQLSFPQLILISWVTEYLLFLTVFQWMYFHMNFSIYHTYWIHFIARMFSVSLHIMFLLPKHKPPYLSSSAFLIYFQYEDW